MSGWTRQTARRNAGRGGVGVGVEGGGRLMERGSEVGWSSGGRDGGGGMRVTEVKRKGWTAQCADITRSGPPRSSRREGWREGRREGGVRTPLRNLTKDAQTSGVPRRSFCSNPSGRGRDFKRMGCLKLRRRESGSVGKGWGAFPSSMAAFG